MRGILRGIKMKLNKLALALIVGFAPAAQASIWDWSFTDIGVNYSLSFDSLVGNTGTYTLTLDTDGYDHHAPPAYLRAVDIKAWGGQITSWSLLSAPAGSAWTETEGSSSNNGCGGQSAGFACAEAVTNAVFDVLDGPYTFQFQVIANNFNLTSAGSHVGALYASAIGDSSSYGLTSVVATPAIPEPETYAMMLAGLGLLGFVARRRRQGLGGSVVPA